MAETPWKPPPLRPTHRRVRGGSLDQQLLDAQRDGVIRWEGGRWIAPDLTRRVWRPLDDTAARFAAPWLALVWVLTVGRMGAPLYRWEIPHGLSTPRLRANRGLDELLDSLPSPGPCGVPPKPVPPPNIEYR